MGPLFEIYINDKKVGTVGVAAENKVLNLIVTYAKRSNDPNPELSLFAGGVDSDKQELFDTLKLSLSQTDEIRLKILENGIADPPISIRSNEQNPAEVLQKKLAYYNKLKEELKDHL